MGPRRRVLVLAGLAGVLVLASAARLALSGVSDVYGPGRRDWVVALVFTAIGARVTVRHPRNTVAWLLLVIGAWGAVSLFAASFADGSAALAWVSQWAWWPALGLLPLVLLRFPDGRLPSPRWRIAQWVAVAGLVVPAGALALATVGQVDLLTSDVSVRAATGVRDALLWLARVGTVVAVAGAVAALVALVTRYGRARGAEREQLKWLLAAGALALAAGVAEAAWSVPGAWLVGASAVPLGIGVAILRYRLYDIDLILKRTLVYGLLSALLAGVYVAGVFLASRLLSPQGGESQLAVAASTLAVAGMFSPARRRIQQAVDRRFNRRRHDALATVQAFGIRLRDQLDLDTLTVEVVGVVQRTMEPTLVSLSLYGVRPRAGARSAQGGG